MCDRDGVPMFVDPETRDFLSRMLTELRGERVKLDVLVNRGERLAERLEWLWERRGKAHG